MDGNHEPYVNSFKDKRILVIGDLMLDKHIDGTVSRVSPEAPVRVLHVKDERFVPGGACNVAVNLASMSGNVSLIGTVGDDASKNKLLEELKRRSIDTSNIITDKTRPTTLKVKLLAKDHHLLRLDHEIRRPISKDIAAKIIKTLEGSTSKYDAVIVSDYNKGLIDQALSKNIIAICKKNSIPVIVDAKPKNIKHYAGADIITLNKGEASKIFELDVPLEEMGKYLSMDLESTIIITAGSEGMHAFRGDERFSVEAHSIALAEPSGAGDTVTATLGLSIAAGAPLDIAIKMANFAASIAVSKPGLVSPTYSDMLGMMKTEISEYLKENMQVKQTVINNNIHQIEQIVRLITDAYKNNKKVLIFGNGGSAADAMHFAAELVGRFKIERKALPAINLTADSSIMTAVGNDYGFDAIFSRQVEALAQKDDVLIGISTSGNSQNVINAMEAGKKIGASTVSFLGKDGGKLNGVCDVSIVVPSDNTPRIQETHITIVHIICELLENKMFK